MLYQQLYLLLDCSYEPFCIQDKRLADILLVGLFLTVVISYVET